MRVLSIERLNVAVGSRAEYTNIKCDVCSLPAIWKVMYDGAPVDYLCYKCLTVKGVIENMTSTSNKEIK